MKPINLNQARKARAKAKARSKADANSVRFGRTKAQKKLEKAQAEQAAQRLDALRRETE